MSIILLLRTFSHAVPSVKDIGLPPVQKLLTGGLHQYLLSTYVLGLCAGHFICIITTKANVY